MKKSTLTLSILAALLATSAVVHAAAPTAELKVTGKLIAPTCTVAAPDNGTYDFGNISSTLIKAAAETSLPAKTKTWSVSCDAETYLTFSVVDNRSDSSPGGPAAFGLGKVNTTGTIGYYTAEMSASKVDGVASRLFRAASGATTITPAASVSIAKGTNMGWASAGSSTLQSGRVFTSDITVTPRLSSSTDMKGPITDTVNLDGLMTMTFAFGL